MKGKIKNMVGRLLRQREIPVIGGTLWMLRQVTFYISIINFVMISRVFWDTNTGIRSIFPNYWAFLFLGLGTITLVAMVIEYKVVLPSLFKFQQYQSYRLERSPIYKEVIELRRDVKKLLEKTKGKK